MTEIDGVPVHNTRDLHGRMWSYCDGDTADFTIMREGRPIVLHVTIADAVTEAALQTDARNVADAWTSADTKPRLMRKGPPQHGQGRSADPKKS